MDSSTNLKVETQITKIREYILFSWQSSLDPLALFLFSAASKLNSKSQKKTSPEQLDSALDDEAGLS